MSSAPGTLIVVGSTRPSQSGNVEYYDPEANEWIQAFKIDTENRFDFKSVILDGKLILVGGESYSKGYKTTVTSYDFETGEVSEMPPFLVEARLMCVAVVSRHMYVMGGDDSEYLTRVERYSPYTNKWENVAPMLKGRYNFGCAVLNGEIYILGGVTPSGSKDVHVYNPIHDSWREVASMNEPRAGLMVTALDGYLYAICGSGGGTLANTSERYDPTLDKWTYIRNHTLSRRQGDAEVLNNSIILAGGYNVSFVEVNDVESYDPVENKWTVIASLNEPRVSFSLVKAPWIPKKKQIEAKVKSNN